MIKKTLITVFLVTWLMTGCSESTDSGLTTIPDVPADYFAAHHVGMGVDSIEESTAWYKETLGFEFDKKFRLEYIKCDVVFLRRENFRLELFEFDEGRDVPDYRSDPASDLQHGGISHVAFKVGDVRVLAQRLEELDVVFTIPVTEFVEGNPVAFISDPSGNIIELYQAPGDQ